MTNETEAPITRKRQSKRVAFSTKSVQNEFPVLKAQASRQEVDEFAGQYHLTAGGSEHSIIEPMYPPQVLNRYAMSSGVLRTCIEAMATNIDGFGYTLEYIGPEDDRQKAEVQAEHQRVMGLLDHPNGDYSLIDMRKRFRVDKESAGYGALEVVRNEEDGFPDMLYHVPGHTVRMTTQDTKETEALRYLPRPGATNGSMLKLNKRFRRAVQIVNGKPVYFRESGDPRRIDKVTGKPMGDEAEGIEATDLVLEYIYAPGSRYGAPRWVGDLRSVLGIQESESVNLGYFKDNGIPAMMVFVLGGGLTEQGMESFEESLRSNKGQAMQQKVALIEVAGDAFASSEEGVINRPDVKVQSLTRERQTDAFFQEFEKNAAKKIRSSFRLPAMFTGLTEEVRYSVAEASLTVAENQVFGPERAQTDDMFNYNILTYNGEPMRFWRFRSNPPRITSEDAVMDAIETFDSVGAMTPNVGIQIANEMLDMQIAVIEEEWGDIPFQWTLAQASQSEVTAPPSGEEGQNTEPTAKAAPKPKPTARRRRRHKDADRVLGSTLKTLHEYGSTDENGVRVRRRRRVIKAAAAAPAAQQEQTNIAEEPDDATGN